MFYIVKHCIVGRVLIVFLVKLWQSNGHCNGTKIGRYIFIRSRDRVHKVSDPANVLDLKSFKKSVIVC